MAEINKSKQNNVDLEDLRSKFRIENSELVYREDAGLNNHIKAGTVAGSISKYKGYRVIWYNGHYYQAHRLRFLYETGEWPKGIIDHSDRNKVNNGIDNLLDSTTRANASNKSNNSKIIGTTKNDNRWEAAIYYNDKRVYLGLYSSQEAAGAAYQKALLEISLGIPPTNYNRKLFNKGYRRNGTGWTVQFTIRGRQVSLGTFRTEETAIKKVALAREMLATDPDISILELKEYLR